MKFGVGRASLRTVPASTELATRIFERLAICQSPQRAPPTCFRWANVAPGESIECHKVCCCAPIFAGRQLRRHSASFANIQFTRQFCEWPFLNYFFYPRLSHFLAPRAGSWLFGPSRFNSPSYVRVEQKKARADEMRPAFRSKA
jgi:hypothetical protein